MNEVSADEQLRTTVCEGANGVGVPYFLKEAFSHGEDMPWFTADEKLHGWSAIVKAASYEKRGNMGRGSILKTKNPSGWPEGLRYCDLGEEDYFSWWITGAASPPFELADSIGLKTGRGRRAGGLESLVQQQEADHKAAEQIERMDKKRII